MTRNYKALTATYLEVMEVTGGKIPYLDLRVITEAEKMDFVPEERQKIKVAKFVDNHEFRVTLKDMKSLKKAIDHFLGYMETQIDMNGGNDDFNFEVGPNGTVNPLN